MRASAVPHPAVLRGIVPALCRYESANPCRVRTALLHHQHRVLLPETNPSDGLPLQQLTSGRDSELPRLRLFPCSAALCTRSAMRQHPFFRSPVAPFFQAGAGHNLAKRASLCGHESSARNRDKVGGIRHHSQEAWEAGGVCQQECGNRTPLSEASRPQRVYRGTRKAASGSIED